MHGCWAQGAALSVPLGKFGIQASSSSSNTTCSTVPKADILVLMAAKSW
eukprot:CAMPEP_0178400370 /NCGR_PEP_ID=MMETSP0689_2-20121128/15755_1 /TAXON_ID=160604 /ORGANISM="Amphidinium massartii, Strain CS-259" /LENGTH=48 /DNA_ID= /DNA_START= /DNA_END= /DNA_ORIENTATION=